jgi:hypothetical protein
VYRGAPVFGNVPRLLFPFMADETRRQGMIE